MRTLEFITGHVIYNLSYTYKFQLKTPIVVLAATLKVKQSRKQIMQAQDSEICLFFGRIKDTINCFKIY